MAFFDKREKGCRTRFDYRTQFYGGAVEIGTIKNEKEGVLYILGTPIGNLGDISLRALQILKSTDFIAAEDTRVTAKLLMHFGINKPLLSCHEHNINKRSFEIISRIKNGESCVLVSDAGMPCISDPGEGLVKLSIEQGTRMEVIPGPSALIAALSISGLGTSRFSFEGFLSVTKKQRTLHLESIKEYPNTLIFYEAPHKLVYTLNDLLSVLGDREIALCRELTKIHEEVLRGKISEMLEYYAEKSPRGEYVLVIEGYKGVGEDDITLDQAAEMTQKLILNGYKLSEACKITAEKTNFKKSEIYKYIVDKGENKL